MTVFLDLSQIEGTQREEVCDVCVVGAGAAGLYLATRLASAGMDVIVLEAGGMRCRDGSVAGFEAFFPDSIYSGVTQGRAFGVGGTTAVWGGVLLPHTVHDLRGGEMEGRAAWDEIVRRVAQNSTAVLDTLGWRGPVDFEDYPVTRIDRATADLRRAGLSTIAALWLPFRLKNLSFLLKSRPNGAGRVRVVHDAVAKGWSVSRGEGSRDVVVRSVFAAARGGKSLRVQATRFVLAAGAIESARILLEMNTDWGLCLGEALGAYLSDHLSVSVAEVSQEDLAEAARLFGPSFSRGWMRNYRFLESMPPSSAPRSFAHFVFENDSPGFRLAKEVLTSLQARRLPHVSVSEAVSGMKGLLGLGYARFARSVLHIPRGSKSHMQLDVEQAPLQRNRVTLSETTDCYGRRIPVVHWGVSQVDIRSIETTANRFLAKWPGERAGLPSLSRIDIQNVLIKPHDTYHPTGICRMGPDSESVVDLDLRVRGLNNVWLISTGVLPSAGTANPTFSMLCLAETLAQTVLRNLRGDPIS